MQKALAVGGIYDKKWHSSGIPFTILSPAIFIVSQWYCISFLRNQLSIEPQIPRLFCSQKQSIIGFFDVP